MTTESRAAFARRLGVNKSTVTRAADAGRLVFAADGSVDVEASLIRWAATSGGRDDVAARHAAHRGAEIPVAQSGAETALQGATDGATPPQNGLVESRAAAQARKETAAANLLEMEIEQKRGKLIPRDDVDTALKAFAAATRSRLDVLADRLAPVVAPVTAMEEVHALLSENFRDVLASIADDMQRAEAALAHKADGA